MNNKLLANEYGINSMVLERITNPQMQFKLNVVYLDDISV
jgi:hypothetical protein